jgi:HemY protein
VPAASLAGRLLGRRGDLRKASKLLEAAWKSGPHPDLARVYLDLRPGDSTSDRLQRARALARFSPDDPEAILTVARAAIDATDYALARRVLDPLVGPTAAQRPSVRTCLLMADLEEAESGNAGLVREWLSRASRAPRDKAWVADGVVSDVWAPVSPVTGKLDAYRWQVPPERLSPAPYEPLPEPAPEPVAPPVPVLLEAPAVPEADPPQEVIAAAATTTETEPEPEATQRLAAIRAAAKAPSPVSVPPLRKPETFPLVTAPDDPGPDPRG